MDHQEENKALKDYDVLTTKEEYLGIPTKLFISIIALSVIVGFAARSVPIGLFLLLVMGIPTYRAHQKDPQAYYIFLRVLWRPADRWCAGQKKNNNRRIYILRKEI